MRFEARELAPYVEHVEANALRQGEVYFIASFWDDEMLVPELKPVVFVKRNLEPDDDGKLYFQDVVSYQRGVRHKVAEGGLTQSFSVFLRTNRLVFASTSEPWTSSCDARCGEAPSDRTTSGEQA